jgi:hypothetical protein
LKISKDSILRELGKLLAKYTSSQLLAAITLLKRNAVSVKSQNRPRRRMKSKRRDVHNGLKRSKPRAKTTKTATRSQRSELRARTQRLLESTVSRWRMEDIRRALDQLGIAEPLPSRKEKAAKALVAHLQGTPKEQLPAVIRKLRARDERGDYARWVQLISGIGRPEAERSGPSSARARVTETTKLSEPGNGAKPLERRLENLLLGNSFKLLNNAESRVITFLADGTIGKGRTSSESTWRLSQGHLELINHQGEVRGRFLLSNDGRSLHPAKYSNSFLSDIQQLVRVTAK